MKLPQLILHLSLLLIPLIFIVESTSTSDNLNNPISRGSSLSASSHDTSYWLSPSGNIAFGFYPLPCKRSSSDCKYAVGIWFVKSPRKTLVWTANRDDLPLSNLSSIHLATEGKFILHKADNKDASLVPDVHEPVSYARLHDDGNFVLYGSDSKIVWQSFDHPTDTILGGQQIKNGIELVSSVSSFNFNTGKYKLLVNWYNGIVAIYKFGRLGQNEEDSTFVVSHGYAGCISRPVTLYLETSGNLYLVDSHNVVLRVFYEHKTKQHEDDDVGQKYIYKATLNPEGHFNLYKERIDGTGDEKSAVVLLWSTYSFWTKELASNILWGLIPLAIIGFICSIVFIIAYEIQQRRRWKAVRR